MEEIIEKTGITRNQQGKFVKGVSGNPNGRGKLTEKERIIKTVVKKTKQDVLEYLKKQGFGAAQRIISISKNAENETVKLNANKDVLDRIGVGVEKNNIGFAVQVNINEDKEKFK